MFKGGKIIYDMNIYFDNALRDMKFCACDHEICFKWNLASVGTQNFHTFVIMIIARILNVVG